MQAVPHGCAALPENTQKGRAFMKKLFPVLAAMMLAGTCCGMPAAAETSVAAADTVTDPDTIFNMVKTYASEQALAVGTISKSFVSGYVTVRCKESSSNIPAAFEPFFAENHIDPGKVLFSFDCSNEAEKLAGVLLPYLEESDLNMLSCGLHQMPGFFTVVCKPADYLTVKRTLNGVLEEHELSTRRLMVICPDDAPVPIKGDLNFDGKITATDAQICLGYALDLIIESGETVPEAADIDQDGEVSPLDAQYLLTYYLQSGVIGDDIRWSDIGDGLNDSQTYATDNFYTSDQFTIRLSSYYLHGTNAYVTDFRVADAKYLKTAFANNTYGSKELQPTSDIAKANNAVLAVNGDYYSYHTYGYVVRNGVAYRDLNNGHWLGCLFNDGDFRILSSNECRAASLVEDGCWQQFDFGPVLLNNSEITVGVDEDVAQRLSSNPRTAFGMIEPLHYAFVVSDGRSTGNAGLSLWQVAEFMQQFDTKVLYNLDGGGSSTMYFQGRVINQPVNYNRIEERVVSDIVYVGK